MRRTMLVLVACALTSFAIASTSQAATSLNGGSTAGRGTPAANKAPKPTVYHVNVYNGAFEKFNEATAYLYNKTKTWNVETFCDNGTYSKVGKKLTLTDVCTNETWKLEKVKPPAKNTYFGPAFNEFNEFTAYDEFIKM